MPISKSRISSPLEAGSSLLDAAQLPPQLTAAMEYVSERLARKGLHLELIVVRKHVQMPEIQSPPPSSAGTTPPSLRSPASSPTRSLFSAAATGITKVLNRHSSRASLSSETGSVVSKTSSVGTLRSIESRASLSRTRWGSLPASPRDRSAFPPTSSASSSPSSSALSSPSSSPEPGIGIQGANPYGITLMHASTLTAKAEKILRYIVGRAERNFGVGTGYLPPTSHTKNVNATQELIQRSLLQNSILFTSTGLTLLALDHLYTFKHHLHTYSRSLSPADFTVAVDELHRLVLSRRSPPHITSTSVPVLESNSSFKPKDKDKPIESKITRSELARTYDWFYMSLAALVDVDEGYKAAYGGLHRTGAIEGVSEEKKRVRVVPAPPPIETSFARRIMEIRRLKLRSSTCSSICSAKNDDEDANRQLEHGRALQKKISEVSFGESAKGVELDEDGKNTMMTGDEGERKVEVGVGVQIEKLEEDRGPHRRGAVTPNGFEDITPVTRGSWKFLMIGDGWKEGRRAPVETC